MVPREVVHLAETIVKLKGVPYADIRGAMVVTLAGLLATNVDGIEARMAANIMNDIRVTIAKRIMHADPAIRPEDLDMGSEEGATTATFMLENYINTLAGLPDVTLLGTLRALAIAITDFSPLDDTASIIGDILASKQFYIDRIMRHDATTGEDVAEPIRN